MATAAALTSDASPEDRLKALLAGFKGDIQPVSSPVGYRLGIGLVAVVMILLPLIYLGLIGLVCWGVYYHAVNHVGILGSVRGRGAIMTFLVYLAPLVIGGILILFMLKPLFSRPARQPRLRRLKRAEEPVLFAFVERVCDAVGAPRPRQIHVDCEVNASASFRRGLWSMLGNDLVLTIGTPLVAGLNLREFAGVLAHEFGHFAQGAGMRLTYVIRSISFWFTRVVYERDEWDQRLVDWSQELDIRISWILYLAQFFVWGTRRVLWVLMMTGHAVSGYMLRQMELDADRHETRLAGSDTFAATVRQLHLLNYANQGAQADLGRFYQEGRLADDLPHLIMANVDQLPPPAHAAAEEAIKKSETGWFDTHPCDRERIANAQRENARGIFRLEEPATLLFNDFPETARDVTLNFYQNIFGKQFRREAVHPVGELLARQGQELDTYKALNRYFQGAFSAWRRMPLARWDLAEAAQPEQAAARLGQVRKNLLVDRPQFQEAFKQFDEGDTWMLQAGQGRALLDAKVRAAKTDFARPLHTSAQVAEMLRDAAARQEQTEPELAGFEARAADRLLTALDLLATPPAVESFADARERRRECRKLLSTLSMLESQVGLVVQLRNTYAALGMLLSKWESNQENATFGREVQGLMPKLYDQIQGLRGPLAKAPYPFDHADKDISIGAFAVPNMPSAEDLGGLMDAADALVRTLPQLRARLLGRLCQIAEEVETHLGLEALPEPPKEEKEGEE